MNLDEFLRMVYGLFMGTSVQYIKPANRYVFPTKVVEVDKDFSIQLGGTSILGYIKSGESNLLINPGHQKAFDKFVQAGKLEAAENVNHLILTNFFLDNVHFLQACENPIEKVYYPKSAEFSMKKLFAPEVLQKFSFEEIPVDQELELTIEKEVVKIQHVNQSYSASDLYVVLPERKLVFLGGLFYNQIHPVLRIQEGMDVRNWIAQLEKIVAAYADYQFIPIEGEVATSTELQLFIDYLKALINPEVEFSYCRKNFDWMEIPSHTSLEENFDLLRGIAKNFVSL